MSTEHPNSLTVKDIQHNCNISDARDHGIYTMCTMVLKLRNLYKWEKDLDPWQEPEPGDLLDWIEDKENYWKTIVDEPYRPLNINGYTHLPDDLSGINGHFEGDQMVYGAGYGRSLKAVFFLAEKIEQRTVAGLPVFILGRERAREMASPFCDGTGRLNFYQKRTPPFFFMGLYSGTAFFLPKLLSPCTRTVWIIAGRPVGSAKI